MSYIDDLNQAASEALAASSSATDSAQIMFDVANGTETSTVSTANGPVDTLAKAINDLKNQLSDTIISSSIEEVALSAGQTSVTLTQLDLDYTTPLLFVEGSFEQDFTVTSNTEIELGQSFPDGTRLWVIQNLPSAFSDLQQAVDDAELAESNAQTSETNAAASALEASESNEKITRLNRSFSLSPYNRESLRLDFAEQAFGAGDLAGINQSYLDTELLDITRTSTATYTDVDGLIKTAAVDELRYSFDPITKESLGALIEESRTNKLLWSEDFTDVFWTKSQSTASPNTTSSPDGTVAAETIDFSLLNASVYRDSITVTSENNYTGSVYWKENSTPLGNYSLAFYDLSNSEFIDIVLPDIKDLGNGWKRASYTIMAPAGCTSLRFYAARLTTGSSGDLYLWGAQLEEGSTPSSYIPTTDSPVTRAADTVSRTLGEEFNQSDFTAVFKFRPGRVTSGGDRYFNFSDASGGNRFEVGYVSDDRLNIIVGVDGVFSTNTVVVPTGYSVDGRDLLTVGLVKEGGVYRAIVNGGTIRESLAGEWSGATTMGVGSSVSTTDGGGEFEYVKYYPYALTEQELVELTS